jgi:hypothetical protein
MASSHANNPHSRLSAVEAVFGASHDHIGIIATIAARPFPHPDTLLTND